MNHEEHEGREENPTGREGFETPADLPGPASPGCDLGEAATGQGGERTPWVLSVAACRRSRGRRRRPPGQRRLRVLRVLRGQAAWHVTRPRRTDTGRVLYRPTVGTCPLFQIMNVRRNS